MSFTEEDIRAAGKAISLPGEQVDGLLAVLRASQANRATPQALQANPERVRFDLVHVLWYMGALIVIGAMGLFSTLAFQMMGGGALTITALVYAALFTVAGFHLWHDRGLRTPGGLMIAIAVAMVPLAVYGIQDEFGLWGKSGDPGHYGSFYEWIKSSWIPMEIATVVAGLVALRFFPFSFITAIVAWSLWFLSMDLAPWLFKAEDLSWELRKRVSMMFGLVVLIVAWATDLKRDQRQDIAFWLYLSGLLAFWGGLTLSDSDSEIAKVVYCLLNVVLVFLSIFLMRRAFAVFGAVGISIYLSHLANRVFEDSLLFPFALSLIGILIIAAGLFLHRHRAELSAWVAERLPETLKKLRPPHAGGVIRMEHA